MGGFFDSIMNMGINVSLKLMPMMSGAEPSGGWDLGTFLDGAKVTLEKWFGSAALLVGLVCIMVAIWQIASGLMSQGKKQTNWALSIILLFVGGMLAAANGFSFVQGIAKGGQKTISELGNVSTIVIGTKMFLGL